MEEKKTCKHILHKAFDERSYETKNTDLVTVGLYCPKCLHKTVLTWSIPASREFIKEGFDFSSYMLASKFVIPNLLKLGYTENQVENILELSMVSGRFDKNKFEDHLKAEHTKEIDSILTMELL